MRSGEPGIPAPASRAGAEGDRLVHALVGPRSLRLIPVNRELKVRVRLPVLHFPGHSFTIHRVSRRGDVYPESATASAPGALQDCRREGTQLEVDLRVV